MANFNKITTKTAQESQGLGEEIGNKLVPPRVICLYGQLGSGKTTFVQGLGKGLAITTRLLSPTFIIVRRYKLPRFSGFLYHLDLFRVKEGDLDEIAISDILSDSSSIVVVEWADKLGSWLPKDRTDIRFTVLANGNHEIRFETSN